MILGFVPVVKCTVTTETVPLITQIVTMYRVQDDPGHCPSSQVPCNSRQVHIDYLTINI